MGFLCQAQRSKTLRIDQDGAPFGSHLPVLYRREGEAVELVGHWSRANPQWRHAGPATVILHGPDAYVSPAWYPDKEAAARVPTWNYAVAHLIGGWNLVEDDDGLADIVTALSDRFEAEAGSNWRFEPDRPDHRKQLRGIVGFRFRTERVELKFKLNQNHPAANVAAAATALAHGNERQRAIAGLMRARLPATTSGERP